MTTIKDMLAQANAAVPKIAPAQVRDMLKMGSVTILDVRDPSEVAVTGKLKGAINVSRGLLEFRADPASPAYSPALQTERPVVIYCGSGGRAALAGKTLQDLGYKTVHNAGGFGELAAAGLEVEPA